MAMAVSIVLTLFVLKSDLLSYFTGISFDELRVWLHEKAKRDASWKAVASNPSVFRAAHMFAAEKVDQSGVVSVVTKVIEPRQFVLSGEERIFGLEQFKSFLMHLFVLSILYVHFKRADEWSEGKDEGNDRLTLTEFKLACRTFLAAQANEEISEEKVEADFKLLDSDGNGTLDFLEVFYLLLTESLLFSTFRSVLLYLLCLLFLKRCHVHCRCVRIALASHILSLPRSS